MSEELSQPELSVRVRGLAQVFTETGLLRLRVEREGETIELGRRARAAAADDLSAEAGEVPRAYDAIKADLVGVFRLSRPAPVEGELIRADRDLAIVEALGIRNPVRSMGAGRIVRIACKDGDPVEYGQTLFEIDRG
ncbi:MAG: acetyl-CoA carboxylase biotin carboxyl carrier protein [Vulcanimicrobiaceae bacterium]